MTLSQQDDIEVLKALSDQTRFEIVCQLRDGEKCACMLLERFDMTQPALSYHMKKLVESGLVNARRDGTWMRYSLNRTACDQAIQRFSALLGAGAPVGQRTGKEEA